MALIKIVDLMAIPLRNVSGDGTIKLLDNRVDEWIELNGYGIFLYSIGETSQIVLFENGTVMMIPGNTNMIRSCERTFHNDSSTSISEK